MREEEAPHRRSRPSLPALSRRGLMVPAGVLLTLSVLSVESALPRSRPAFVLSPPCSRSNRLPRLWMAQNDPSPSSASNRRDFINAAALGLLAGAGVVTSQPAEAAVRPPSPLIPPPPPSPRPLFWEVLMTNPPQMQPYTPLGQDNVFKFLASECSALFLGEHPGDSQDQILEAKIIDKLYQNKGKGLVVGLEQVQQPFQFALDDYISKKVPDLQSADAALKEATQWDDRWGAPFESYLPILHLARERGIKLVAVNVESEAIAKVRAEGLEGLSIEEKNKYVADPSGFIRSVKDPSFKLYTERFVLPSYRTLKDQNKLGDGDKVLSPAKFFAARILWDEAMASRVLRHLEENPKDFMVVCTAADHVKFGLGAPFRLERLMKNLEIKTQTGGKVKSMLLNPTPDDTGSYTKRLKLALSWSDNLALCKPVADYILYSSYPKVAWLQHPQNPIDFPFKENDFFLRVFSDDPIIPFAGYSNKPQ